MTQRRKRLILATASTCVLIAVACWVFFCRPDPEPDYDRARRETSDKWDIAHGIVRRDLTKDPLTPEEQLQIEEDEAYGRRYVFERYTSDLANPSIPPKDKAEILENARTTYGWTEEELMGVAALYMKPGMTPAEEQKALESVGAMARSKFTEIMHNHEEMGRDPRGYYEAETAYFNAKVYLAKHCSSETVASAVRAEIVRAAKPALKKDLYDILGRSGLDSSRRFLVEQLSRETDFLARQWVSAALSRLENTAAEQGAPSLEPLITHFKTATNREERLSTLSALASGQLPAFPEVEALLWGVVRTSTDPTERADAARGLSMAALDDREVEEYVALARDDRDPVVRSAAWSGLQNHSSRPPVRSYMLSIARESRDVRERQYAARLLTHGITAFSPEQVEEIRGLASAEAAPEVKTIYDKALEQVTSEEERRPK